jgi:hypothetical protein
MNKLHEDKVTLVRLFTEELAEEPTFFEGRDKKEENVCPKCGKTISENIMPMHLAVCVGDHFSPSSNLL